MRYTLPSQVAGTLFRNLSCIALSARTIVSNLAPQSELNISAVERWVAPLSCNYNNLDEHTVALILQAAIQTEVADPIRRGTRLARFIKHSL